jgi:two-component system cell cycle response regulator
MLRSTPDQFPLGQNPWPVFESLAAAIYDECPQRRHALDLDLMPNPILIVDDMAVNRLILKVRLESAFHRTIQAADGTEAVEIARRERPKLILLDLNLPDISGVEVCRQLRADLQTRHIPIIIVTSSGDRVSRLRALEAGADDFLTKPLDETILLARIRSLMRAHETAEELRLRAETFRDLGFDEGETEFTRPGLVGLVSSEASTLEHWRETLGAHLNARIALFAPSETLAMIEGFTPLPDLFVVDATREKPRSAMGLVADLRSRSASRHTAISVVLRRPDADTAAMALDLGANDLLIDPLDPEETALRIQMSLVRKARVDRLRRQLSDGLQMAVTDPLTGLYNRRYALHHLDRIVTNARGSGNSYAVMVLDIDRFKSVNDTYGHAAGDAVITAVATRLRESLRPSDLIARIGGEEFLVVLPDVDELHARRTAERLRRSVEATEVEIDALSIKVTISVGLALAGLPGEAEGKIVDAARIMALADEALLSSKAEGRNQVTVSSSAA